MEVSPGRLAAQSNPEGVARCGDPPARLLGWTSSIFSSALLGSSRFDSRKGGTRRVQVSVIHRDADRCKRLFSRLVQVCSTCSVAQAHDSRKLAIPVALRKLIADCD